MFYYYYCLIAMLLPIKLRHTAKESGIRFSVQNAIQGGKNLLIHYLVRKGLFLNFKRE